MRRPERRGIDKTEQNCLISPYRLYEIHGKYLSKGYDCDDNQTPVTEKIDKSWQIEPLLHKAGN